MALILPLSASVLKLCLFSYIFNLKWTCATCWVDFIKIQHPSEAKWDNRKERTQTLSSPVNRNNAEQIYSKKFCCRQEIKTLFGSGSLLLSSFDVLFGTLQWRHMMWQYAKSCLLWVKTGFTAFFLLSLQVVFLEKRY